MVQSLPVSHATLFAGTTTRTTMTTVMAIVTRGHHRVMVASQYKPYHPQPSPSYTRDSYVHTEYTIKTPTASEHEYEHKFSRSSRIPPPHGGQPLVTPHSAPPIVRAFTPRVSYRLTPALSPLPLAIRSLKVGIPLARRPKVTFPARF